MIGKFVRDCLKKVSFRMSPPYRFFFSMVTLPNIRRSVCSMVSAPKTGKTKLKLYVTAGFTKLHRDTMAEVQDPLWVLAYILY